MMAQTAKGQKPAAGKTKMEGERTINEKERGIITADSCYACRNIGWLRLI